MVKPRASRRRATRGWRRPQKTPEGSTGAGPSTEGCGRGRPEPGPPTGDWEKEGIAGRFLKKRRASKNMDSAQGQRSVKIARTDGSPRRITADFSCALVERKRIFSDIYSDFLTIIAKVIIAPG